MDLCFLLPALRPFGYESGFSFKNPRWGKQDGFDLAVARFRNGALVSETRVSVPPDQFHIRIWESDVGAVRNQEFDLLVIRAFHNGTDKQIEGLAGTEGQMLFRNSKGWNSSLLSAFVPLRPSGYRFAPIIHTGHYFADYRYMASHTLLLNRKSCDGSNDAGSMVVSVKSQAGQFLGQVKRTLQANSVSVFSLDDILDECAVEESIRQEGVNLTYSGGASQFSILTLFQERTSGSIGLEHSLAPLYYIPQLIKQPAIRARIYSWVGK